VAHLSSRTPRSGDPGRARMVSGDAGQSGEKRDAASGRRVLLRASVPDRRCAASGMTRMVSGGGRYRPGMSAFRTDANDRSRPKADVGAAIPSPERGQDASSGPTGASARKVPERREPRGLVNAITSEGRRHHPPPSPCPRAIGRESRMNCSSSRTAKPAEPGALQSPEPQPSSSGYDPMSPEPNYRSSFTGY